MTYGIEVLILPVSAVDRARASDGNQWVLQERGFRNQRGSGGA